MWWERAIPLVSLRPAPATVSIFGRPLAHAAHRADVLRLQLLIAHGGDIEAEDSYGYRPLHRMASNNLAVGAAALLSAGADVNARASGLSPMQIAQHSAAVDVVRALKVAAAAALTQ